MTDYCRISSHRNGFQLKGFVDKLLSHICLRRYVYLRARNGFNHTLQWTKKTREMRARRQVKENEAANTEYSRRAGEDCVFEKRSSRFVHCLHCSRLSASLPRSSAANVVHVVCHQFRFNQSKLLSRIFPFFIFVRLFHSFPSSPTRHSPAVKFLFVTLQMLIKTINILFLFHLP